MPMKDVVPEGVYCSSQLWNEPCTSHLLGKGKIYHVIDGDGFPDRKLRDRPGY